MPPSVFFPVFVRFIKSYRVSLYAIRASTSFWFTQGPDVICHCFQQADEENEQKKRQEQLMMEKLLEQEAMMEEQENQQVG